ncbi:MAG: hypothetical protein ABS951_15460 [Solibacillus sp.]
MILLLVVGLGLASSFFYAFYILKMGYAWRASFIGVFLFAAITCYPLAISYGRGQIIDIFHSIHKGERQPLQVKHGIWQPVVSFCIALVTVSSFGWVYGSYYAYKRLQMMKSLQ